VVCTASLRPVCATTRGCPPKEAPAHSR
jgi:hypothetical protein